MRSTCLNVAEIKRQLDVGAQTLVIPYVQTVKKAELTAAAEDYPSAGIRGVSGGSRCNKYGSVPGYFENALFAFRISHWRAIFYLNHGLANAMGALNGNTIRE